MKYVVTNLKKWNEGDSELKVDFSDENEKIRFDEFIMILDKYINGLNDDLSDYSKYKLRITLGLNGFDEDEAFHSIKILRNIFIDNRIGTLDLRKPVELSNNIIALIEF